MWWIKQEETAKQFVDEGKAKKQIYRFCSDNKCMLRKIGNALKRALNHFNVVVCVVIQENVLGKEILHVATSATDTNK